ncbi:MAG TPA: hypothetical protein VFE62_09455, partial [Gemmataceae bacterium]|nr:hypothetical protein [Gemmataceae bacterium]
ISRLHSVTKLTICGGLYNDGDVAPLAALGHLEELETSENDRIDGTYTQFLPALRQLKNLAPGSSITDDGLGCISRLLLLKTLFLEGSFSDVGMLELRALQRLETLYVTAEQVTDDSVNVIAALRKLRRLGLDAPRFTDAGALALSRCRELEYLAIFKSALTAVGQQRLRDAMPDCEIQFFGNLHANTDADEQE